MRFRSVEQAIKFAFNMSERSEYSRSDPMKVRGTQLQDYLSPTDLHAQAAMIQSMLDRLHPAEKAAVLALYGRGRARSDGIRGLTDFLWPSIGGSLPQKIDAQIVMPALVNEETKHQEDRGREGVSYRQVCNWRSAVLRSWMPYVVRATERLHDRMFGEHGFELEQ
jgi:hypothetical protein